MFTEFGLAFFFGFPLDAFWSLINSQQNIAFMPIMTVANPGMVNFYLEVLVSMTTFDPFDMEPVYELFGGWNFDWTA